MKLRLLFIFALLWAPVLEAQQAIYPSGVSYRPSITITTATVDTTPFSTTGMHEALVQWKFGTVTGTYTTCTSQAKTSIDGTNYLTLGSAVTVTATSSTTTAWLLQAQAPTTSVTTSAASSTVALGFGVFSKFTFACSGAYGTTAPVTVSVITR